MKGRMVRPFENAEIEERGPTLFKAWQTLYRDMGTRWAQADPKTRVKWAGPDMSVRSSITARQMETWAHGHEVFDQLGVNRQDTDRIRNIVILGVNTFGWSHKVQGLDMPEQMPLLRLTAPSGELWEFGEDADNMIEGAATAFAQVDPGPQHCRHRPEGYRPVAARWMATAQCFAGPPETPPAKGARHVVQV